MDPSTLQFFTKRLIWNSRTDPDVITQYDDVMALIRNDDRKDNVEYIFSAVECDRQASEAPIPIPVATPTPDQLLALSQASLSVISFAAVQFERQDKKRKTFDQAMMKGANIAFSNILKYFNPSCNFYTDVVSWMDAGIPADHSVLPPVGGWRKDQIFRFVHDEIVQHWKPITGQSVQSHIRLMENLKDSTMPFGDYKGKFQHLMKRLTEAGAAPTKTQLFEWIGNGVTNPNLNSFKTQFLAETIDLDEFMTNCSNVTENAPGLNSGAKSREVKETIVRTRVARDGYTGPANDSSEATAHCYNCGRIGHLSRGGKSCPYDNCIICGVGITGVYHNALHCEPAGEDERVLQKALKAQSNASRIGRGRGGRGNSGKYGRAGNGGRGASHGGNGRPNTASGKTGSNGGGISAKEAKTMQASIKQLTKAHRALLADLGIDQDTEKKAKRARGADAD
jgi:hypothetical protein